MMFWAIFITVITCCHLFVFWRASTIPFLQSPSGRKGLFVSGLITWLLFISGLLYGHAYDSNLSTWLTLGGMIWMGTLFLLTSCFLFLEILSGGGCFFSQRLPTCRAAALLIGLCLAGIALYQGNQAPVITSFEVKLPELPATLDGAVVVVMSDLHLGNLLREDWLAARIAQIRKLQPDLVLLLGDVFEGHGAPQTESAKTMRNLSAPLGVWGVAGNHEFYGGPQTIRALEDGGVKLLRNSWAEISPGLILAGVEEHAFIRRSEEVAGVITKALSGRPPGVTILLSHKPWRAEEASENGVRLMLSGHTHAGQIWPFNLLVSRFFPLLAGRYLVKEMPVLVCRGTGTWGAPMRLWLPGEIMKITLRAGD